MGNVQSRVLLIFFYFLIVTPFGLLVRWFQDPLRLRARGASSHWLERPTASEPDLETARRQF
jgi:hypothetical protein